MYWRGSFTARGNLFLAFYDYCPGPIPPLLPASGTKTCPFCQVWWAGTGNETGPDTKYFHLTQPKHTQNGT
ncbi:hypothetical protein GCM10027594_15010 [Hymenobacter agri]